MRATVPRSPLNNGIINVIPYRTFTIVNPGTVPCLVVVYTGLVTWYGTEPRRNALTSTVPLQTVYSTGGKSGTVLGYARLPYMVRYSRNSGPHLKRNVVPFWEMNTWYWWYGTRHSNGPFMSISRYCTRICDGTEV